MRPERILVPAPRVSQDRDRHRVAVEIEGTEVVFASPDIPLAASSEAFASALWIPALHAGLPLACEAPIDAVWRENAGRLAEVVSGWWGYPALEVDAPAAAAPPGPRAPRTGLCFSGGVDSFYSLLHADGPIDTLLFVVGFDMDLDDTPRIEAAFASLDRIASARDLEVVRIWTNLRDHPRVQALNWERVFGGALAAIGHLAAERLGRLVLPSAVPDHYSLPYGTHAAIDGLWSSSRLEVGGHGDALWRFDKIRAIADDALAQRELRVCWENLAPDGNCSRCEKCLRTLITLEAIDRRAAFTTFDTTTPIEELLATYTPSGGVLAPAFEIELGRGLPAPAAQAVRDLVDRTTARRDIAGRTGVRARGLRRRLFGRS